MSANNRGCHPALRHGVSTFLAFTFLATWVSVWALRDYWRLEGVSLSSRILICSLLYLTAMGWQPIVAVLLVRRYIEPTVAMDAGLRATNPRFLLPGIFVPILAMVAAWCLELVVGQAAKGAPPAVALSQGVPASMLAIASVLLASAVIYAQCLVEEVAWRGYFLVRSMECAGPWRGLALHGLVWGLWYAPILVFSGGGAEAAWMRALEFIVTCVLLGVLLGWLRLASRSVVPPLLGNAVLTLGAGLPIVLSGSEPGPRAAVYFPTGWVPLLLIAAWLALSRHRDAVRTPRPPRRHLVELSAALHYARRLH